MSKWIYYEKAKLCWGFFFSLSPHACTSVWFLNHLVCSVPIVEMLFFFSSLSFYLPPLMVSKRGRATAWKCVMTSTSLQDNATSGYIQNTTCPCDALRARHTLSQTEAPTAGTVLITWLIAELDSGAVCVAGRARDACECFLHRTAKKNRGREKKKKLFTLTTYWKAADNSSM